jgi:thiamine monophosphate kinase
LHLDATSLAAGFGDDYQLLACLPPDDVAEQCARLPNLTVIGRMTKGREVVTLREGRPVVLSMIGYEHGS